MKVRLDKLLLERGLVSSRERGQALILAGKILVDGQKVEKAGAAVALNASVRVLGEDLRYVSRGGLKLEKALEHWTIDVTGMICLDVGTSTGGFTDCLLQHGAAKVIAVDTGYGQIDMRLRQDPRVRLLEKTNARYLKPEDIPECVDLLVIDVSFISATLVLPAVIASGLCSSSKPGQGPGCTRPGGEPDQRSGSTRQLILLVKPQFEVGRELVGKGGIVRDEAAQLDAVKKVGTALENLGAHEIDVIESPILGAEGNREFLLRAKL